MAPKKATKAPKPKLMRRRPAKSSARVSAKVMRKVNRKRPASGLELKVHSILKEEKIPFVKEKTIGSCHADVFIGTHDVIELNGCYWHGCKLCTKKFSKMQLNALDKDSHRYAFFTRLGFKVHVIWECEVDKTPDKVRARLKKIYADVAKNVT
jgi:G:T-mismatch repair DNA endonuclease (very short patch repair protein)